MWRSTSCKDHHRDEWFPLKQIEQSTRLPDRHSNPRSSARLSLHAKSASRMDPFGHESKRDHRLSIRPPEHRPAIDVKPDAYPECYKRRANCANGWLFDSDQTDPGIAVVISSARSGVDGCASNSTSPASSRPQ